MFLEIISPEKTLFDGEIESLILPGSDGSFGILKGHVAIISALKAGIVQITDKEKKEHSIEIKGGTAEVMDNNVIILAS